MSTYRELKDAHVRAFEREFLTVHLSNYEGNVTRAAEAAGLDRSNFLRLMRKIGLKSKDFRKKEDGTCVS